MTGRTSEADTDVAATESEVTAMPVAPAPSANEPEKVNPEECAIRQAPEKPIKVSRKAVIGAAGGSLVLLGIVLGSSFHRGSAQVVQPQDMSQPSGNMTPDAVRNLPASYGAAKLGPALPGDLGKPILERQQQLLSQPTELGQPSDPERGRAAQLVDAERQQAAAQRKAARESGLMVNAASKASGEQAIVDPAPPSAALPGEATPLAAPERDPGGQSPKADFAAAPAKDGPINSHALVAAPSPYLLSAGSTIAASLITGLRSDLPGMVTAQVTENVYDSPTGRILLVPQGARLIGKYDSVVAFGQKRALVVWQRIILPAGSSISLDNMPAADPAGYAGLQDKVDFHTWQLLKGVAISTLLGVGSDLQFSGSGGLVEAIRQSGQQNVSRAGDEATAKALDVQPTLTIRPGAPVRLLVDKDLILAPWHE
jgi:type IV secretion system protein VirB10